MKTYIDLLKTALENSGCNVQIVNNQVAILGKNNSGTQKLLEHFKKLNIIEIPSLTDDNSHYYKKHSKTRKP